MQDLVREQLSCAIFRFALIAPLEAERNCSSLCFDVLPWLPDVTIHRHMYFRGRNRLCTHSNWWVLLSVYYAVVVCGWSPSRDCSHISAVVLSVLPQQVLSPTSCETTEHCQLAEALERVEECLPHTSNPSSIVLVLCHVVHNPVSPRDPSSHWLAFASLVPL